MLNLREQENGFNRLRSVLVDNIFMAEDKEEEHIQTGTGDSCHELLVYARRPRKRCRLCVPQEIWFEILSRLPIKYLLICQSVCKPWRDIVTRVRSKIVSLPLCGLLFPIAFKEPATKRSCISYVSIRPKEVINMQIVSPNSLIVASGCGYDRGLLADLSLDFGALYEEEPSFSYDRDDATFVSYHKGLILRVDGDGTFQVHNPATKEKLVLPESPMVKKYRARLIEKTGIIVRDLGYDINHVCDFLVLRLCCAIKRIDIYSSKTHGWTRSRFDLDDALLRATYFYENHVALNMGRTLHILFLTGSDRGLAVKVKRRNNVVTRVEGFRLPEVMKGGYENAGLGECGGCLHLSYYKEGEGVWIWKNEFMNGDAPTFDVWVPLLEISTARQLCKPVAREHIAKPFDAGESVVPFVFHPDLTIVFLSIRSVIFAYDLTNDTIAKICEMDSQALTSDVVAFPYCPCLNSLNALKRKIRRRKMISWFQTLRVVQQLLKGC